MRYRDIQVSQIITEANRHGFIGFGGHCGDAAVAINRVLFDNKAKYVGAFNKAFWDKNRAIGHIAVMRNRTIWDADGQPKTWDDIETWGMLDSHDPDYIEAADELEIEWNDETASEVEFIEFDNEQEVLTVCSTGRLEELERILQAAKAKVANPRSR